MGHWRTGTRTRTTLYTGARADLYTIPQQVSEDSYLTDRMSSTGRYAADCDDWLLPLRQSRRPPLRRRRGPGRRSTTRRVLRHHLIPSGSWLTGTFLGGGASAFRSEPLDQRPGAGAGRSTGAPTRFRLPSSWTISPKNLTHQLLADSHLADATTPDLPVRDAHRVAVVIEEVRSAPSTVRNANRRPG